MDNLLTVPELLAELERRGVHLNHGTLRSYEAFGIVPRVGVRKWHNGATRRLYPMSFVDDLELLAKLQSLGSLARIKAILSSDRSVCPLCSGTGEFPIGGE